MTFTLVPVHRTYLTDTSAPATGTVQVSLAAPMTNNGEAVDMAPATYALDGTGSVSFSLRATDDLGTYPTSVTYWVVEAIVGKPLTSYYIEVPTSAASAGIDLATVTKLATPGRRWTVAQPLNQRGLPGGYPSLDATGKIPLGQIPDGVGGGGGGTAGVTSVNGKSGVVVLSASDLSTYTKAEADAKFALSTGGVSSVNAKTGAVVLNATDVGAYSTGAADAKFALKTDIPTAPVTSVAGKTGAVVLSATDVGALSQAVADGRYLQIAAAPVTSVNGKTGTVVLNSGDVNAVPASQVGVASGVASLDATGRLTVAQSPLTGRATLYVAASTATAAEKARADYVCDGTADESEINTALTAIRAAGGGTVLLSSGNFYLTGRVLIQGPGDVNDVTTVALRGAGLGNSSLYVGSGVTSGIHLTASVIVHISDLKVVINGGATHGISSAATTAAGYRSFWHSSFKNLRIVGPWDGTHTGWAMYLGSPFRSVFENIEIGGVRNGIKLFSEFVQQNPGDSTFTRIFADLSGNNSVAFQVNNPVDANNGIMNQVEFVMCEAITDGTGGTGILVDGIGTSQHIHVRGSNLEQFDKLLDLQNCADSTFRFNYVQLRSSAAGLTAFNFGANAFDNHILSVGQILMDANQVLFADANASASQPNSLDKIMVYATSGTTITQTLNSATAPTTIRKSIVAQGPGDTSAVKRYPMVDAPQNIITLTDGATITLDASRGNHFRVTLGGNRTLAVPANGTDGQQITLEVIQDATGGRTLTLTSGAGGFSFGGGVTSITLSPTPGKRDVVKAVYSASASAWIVTDPGQSTADARYARSDTGIYVPAGWGSFWRTKRNAAGTGQAVVAAVGSSSTQGLYCGNLLTDSFVSKLRTQLQTQYGNGGSGFFSSTRSLTFLSATTLTNAWDAISGNLAAMSGTWSGGNYYGPGGFYMYTGDAGGYITFAKVNGTTIKIYTMSGGGRANWKYSIDGAADVLVSDSGTPSIQVTTITGLSAGDHTVKITQNSTAGTNLSVCGVTGENATGVIVNNFGLSGATTGTFAPSTNEIYQPTTWNGGPDYPADLLIYALGANDANAGTAIDTYTANVRKFLSAVRDGTAAGGGLATGNTDILILLQHIGKYDNATPKWQDYCDRMRGIAEAYGAALVNAWPIGRNSWNYWNSQGNWGTSGTAGGVAGTDSIHMSNAGHAAVYNAILPILTS